jgi:hypothetical protein
MQGIQCFTALEDAIRAGFSLYDRTPSGYIVRASTPRGYALALVNTGKEQIDR